MNPTQIAIEAALRVALTEFMAWQARRDRPADYKPSPADVELFLAEMRADTPAKIEAEARQELGMPPK